MNLSSDRARLTVAGVVAAVVAFVVFVVPHFGGGGGKKAAPAASATATGPSISAQQQGNGRAAATSSTPPNPLYAGIDASLKGEAADKAVLNTVIPVWGKFQLDWSQDPTSWKDTFNSSPNVADSFVTDSTNNFFQLWTGAMQQGVNVTECKIDSITKKSDKGGVRTYEVHTTSTMKSADPTVTGLSGTYKQTWQFTEADVDGVPQLTGFTIQ